MSPTVAWTVLGLVLLTVEIFSGTFVVLFFGLGALIVAGLRLLGVVDNRAFEILIFAATSLSFLLFFRRSKFTNALRPAKGHAIDKAAVVQLTTDLAPRGNGKIEYQGALWDAHNDSDQPLRKGEQAVVVRTEGIKLVIKPSK